MWVEWNEWVMCSGAVLEWRLNVTKKQWGMEWRLNACKKAAGENLFSKGSMALMSSMDPIVCDNVTILQLGMSCCYNFAIGDELL